MATLQIRATTPPIDIVRSTGLHVTEWTDITLPAWVHTVGVNNQGSGSLWVMVRATGTRGATDDQVEVIASTTENFAVGGLGRISLWGADGATHPFGLILEAAR